MFCRQIVRQSLNNIRLYATEKSPLAALRKKTGYSFVNCKKALELNNNDVLKAEKWLQDQAQALGWAKATKLEGRVTKQGLIGVLLKKNIGAMVEVNCETDFVARNEQFQKFVELASRACLNYVNELPDNEFLTRTEFQEESLKNLTTNNGKKLLDEMALMIGSVGENATLRRAICFKVPDAIQLAGMAYPTPSNSLAAEDQVQLGGYGTIIGVKSSNEISEELKRNLCLQVVGLNPLKIGNEEKDKPADDKDDETCLIYQEYLFDPTVNVGTLLKNNEIKIVDYQRFKCGEELNDQNELGDDAATVAN